LVRLLDSGPFASPLSVNSFEPSAPDGPENPNRRTAGMLPKNNLTAPGLLAAESPSVRANSNPNHHGTP